MAVVYCRGGDHYVDLDYNVEGMFFPDFSYTCWDHLTEAEQDIAENGDCDGEFTPKQVATIARMEKAAEKEIKL